MGIFSKLGANIVLSPNAGLLLAAILMTTSDGDIDQNEIAIIQRLDASGNPKNWNDAIKTYKNTTIDECIQLVAGCLNSEQRVTTIANLIDIAMADGNLAGKEEQLLEKFVEALSIPLEEIEKIISVISVKNSRTAF